jgi:hypothetical protein
LVSFRVGDGFGLWVGLGWMWISGGLVSSRIGRGALSFWFGEGWLLFGLAGLVLRVGASPGIGGMGIFFGFVFRSGLDGLVSLELA